MEANSAAPISGGRIRSIDIMRGLVCVIMAIDHVRVYSGLPAGGPTAGIFFTRWITHFAAPGFCFFAGTGVFFLGRKLGDMNALARYLVTRGLLLVVLEMTVLRWAWTFNFDYAHYLLAGVIWMLGVCMILMGGLVRLPTRAVGIIGLVIIFGQQLILVATRALPEATRHSATWFLKFLYFGGIVKLGADGPPVAVLYSIVPWIGVMAAGYAFGTILTRDAAARRRLCLWIGLSATVAFVVVGCVVVVRRPAPTNPQAVVPPFLFRLLAQQKYPASELFLLMTLGPLIALLPVAENARGWFADALNTIGRVPMFYYLLHIPLIHAAALLVSAIREGHVNPWLFDNHPMMPAQPPVGYVWSLGLLYLVYVLVLPVLYLACRWYGKVKARYPRSVLRFI